MNERQRKFVKEYLVDLNGTQAALRAGYAEDAARKTACRLLAMPEIAAAVTKAQQPGREKRQISADRVIEELGRMAFADIRRFVDWGPDGVSLREKAMLDADDAAAIADVEAKGSNGKIGRIKLYDKLAALNALARHLGMAPARTTVNTRDEEQRQQEALAELRRRLQRIAKGEE